MIMAMVTTKMTEINDNDNKINKYLIATTA